ncbi:hypothetical protein ALT785_580192 [Alteromonas infernus]
MHSQRAWAHCELQAMFLPSLTFEQLLINIANSLYLWNHNFTI